MERTILFMVANYWILERPRGGDVWVMRTGAHFLTQWEAQAMIEAYEKAGI